MGNDRRFVKAQDLPFRLIEVPTGSAPPPPSPPIRRSHKRHAPPNPPPRVQGYDAPPSLRPPSVIRKRYDEPPPPQLPQRFDLDQSNSNKINSSNKKIHKRKLTCCVIS
ncbi:unnamed protein product [Rotaria sordida]|uniref:Uncharacterized protein n=1 Tax=Rotaria sordida TaxID=392033 RepID=A0A819MGY6_9BILA|nr:unnamed protein product [Rotaria sordida]CAF3979541.1 unnamed protein product [Rotaria sordida]